MPRNKAKEARVAASATTARTMTQFSVTEHMMNIVHHMFQSQWIEPASSIDARMIVNPAVGTAPAR
jgi:hypothetical protein